MRASSLDVRALGAYDAKVCSYFCDSEGSDASCFFCGVCGAFVVRVQQ